MPTANIIHMVTVFALLLVVSPPVWGQRRGQERLPGPEDFFEQFLPRPTEADEEALAGISISRRDESRYGSQMVQAYLNELRRQRLEVVRRGDEVEYVRSLVDLIHPFMRNADRYPEIEVFVVDSPQADARSFPGGTLFFFRGLLDLAENEAALVGVVGHELSHLDHGHQLVPLKQTRLLQDTFAGNARGFHPAEIMNTGTMMMRMMSRPFRPQDEAVADVDGAEWAWRAGYDPRELGKLLLRMHERNQNAAIPVPSFFRTHPPSIERGQAVFDRYDELQRLAPRADLYVGRENLERRIPRAKREF